MSPDLLTGIAIGFVGSFIVSFFVAVTFSHFYGFRVREEHDPKVIDISERRGHG